MTDKKRKIIDITSITIIVVIVLLIVFIAPAYQFGLLGVRPELKKAEAGQIKIACVGDSLTYGSNVKGWKKNNYPALLQNKLGNGYVVNNYGLPGATLMDSPMKYSLSKEFKQSLDFKPDVVVMMIGTNDSWRTIKQIQSGFMSEYKNLIEEYNKVNKNVKFKILIPPKANKLIKKEMFYIKDDTLLKHITPIIREVAESEGIDLIDLRSEFKDDKSLYSSDKVHINKKGTNKLANIIFESLK